jgi:hypothetical protein
MRECLFQINDRKEWRSMHKRDWHRQLCVMTLDALRSASQTIALDANCDVELLDKEALSPIEAGSIVIGWGISWMMCEAPPEEVELFLDELAKAFRRNPDRGWNGPHSAKEAFEAVWESRGDF